MAVIGPGAGLPVAEGDVLLYQAVGRQVEQIALAGIHYRVTLVNIPPPSLGSIVDALNSLYAAVMKPMVSELAEWWGSMIRRIFPTPPSAPAATDSLRGFGGAVGELLPRQVAGVVAKLTASAGQAYRGRMYTFFASEANSTLNGTPDAAYLAMLQSLAALAQQTQRVVTVGSCDLEPVIWHKASETFPVPTFTPITLCRARTGWGTQRRRGFFGRPNAPPFP